MMYSVALLVLAGCLASAPAKLPESPARQPAQPSAPVAKKEPRVFVLHGDRRVDDYFWLRNKGAPEYWEPAKYVAKLRAMKSDSNQLLFKINMDPAGHGGASGRYTKLREIAFDYAFVLSQLGIKNWPPGEPETASLRAPAARREKIPFDRKTGWVASG